MLFLKNINQIL